MVVRNNNNILWIIVTIILLILLFKMVSAVQQTKPTQSTSEMISLHTRMVAEWRKRGVQPAYQSIFLSHLDSLAFAEAEQAMRREITQTIQQNSFFFQISQLCTTRTKVLFSLRQLIESIINPTTQLENICKYICKLRERNLQLAEKCIEMYQKYGEVYPSNIFGKIEEENAFIKQSVLNEYIFFGDSYDPFFLNHYEEVCKGIYLKLKHNKSVVDLFQINISYAYRFLKVKNIILQLQREKKEKLPEINKKQKNKKQTKQQQSVGQNSLQNNNTISKIAKNSRLLSEIESNNETIIDSQLLFIKEPKRKLNQRRKKISHKKRQGDTYIIDQNQFKTQKIKDYGMNNNSIQDNNTFKKASRYDKNYDFDLKMQQKKNNNNNQKSYFYFQEDINPRLEQLQNSTQFNTKQMGSKNIVQKDKKYCHLDKMNINKLKTQPTSLNEPIRYDFNSALVKNNSRKQERKRIPGRIMSLSICQIQNKGLQRQHPLPKKQNISAKKLENQQSNQNNMLVSIQKQQMQEIQVFPKTTKVSRYKKQQKIIRKKYSIVLPNLQNKNFRASKLQKLIKNNQKQDKNEQKILKKSALKKQISIKQIEKLEKLLGLGKKQKLLNKSKQYQQEISWNKQKEINKFDKKYFQRIMPEKNSIINTARQKKSNPLNIKNDKIQHQFQQKDKQKSARQIIQISNDLMISKIQQQEQQKSNKSFLSVLQDEQKTIKYDYNDPKEIIENKNSLKKPSLRNFLLKRQPNNIQAQLQTIKSQNSLYFDAESPTYKKNFRIQNTLFSQNNKVQQKNDQQKMQNKIPTKQERFKTFEQHRKKEQSLKTRQNQLNNNKRNKQENFFTSLPQQQIKNQNNINKQQIDQSQKNKQRINKNTKLLQQNNESTNNKQFVDEILNNNQTVFQKNKLNRKSINDQEKQKIHQKKNTNEDQYKQIKRQQNKQKNNIQGHLLSSEKKSNIREQPVINNAIQQSTKELPTNPMIKQRFESFQNQVISNSKILMSNKNQDQQNKIKNQNKSQFKKSERQQNINNSQFFLTETGNEKNPIYDYSTKSDPIQRIILLNQNMHTKTHANQTIIPYQKIADQKIFAKNNDSNNQLEKQKNMNSNSKLTLSTNQNENIFLSPKKQIKNFQQDLDSKKNNREKNQQQGKKFSTINPVKIKMQQQNMLNKNMFIKNKQDNIKFQKQTNIQNDEKIMLKKQQNEINPLNFQNKQVNGDRIQKSQQNKRNINQELNQTNKIQNNKKLSNFQFKQPLQKNTNTKINQTQKNNNQNKQQNNISFLFPQKQKSNVQIKKNQTIKEKNITQQPNQTRSNRTNSTQKLNQQTELKDQITLHPNEKKMQSQKTNNQKVIAKDKQDNESLKKQKNPINDSRLAQDLLQNKKDQENNKLEKNQSQNNNDNKISPKIQKSKQDVSSQNNSQQKSRGIQKQKKQKKMRTGRLNFNQMLNKLQSINVQAQYSKIFDINKIIQQMKYNHTYFTQFLENNLTIVVALSMPLSSGQLAIKYWAPLVQFASTEQLKTLFDKYISYLQKNTSFDNIVFHGSFNKQLSSFNFQYIRQEQYVKKRTNTKISKQNSYQQFLSIQCSHIQFLETDKKINLYSQQIQSFNDKNHYSQEYLTTLNLNHVPTPLMNLYKSNPSLTNFQQVNDILQSQQFDTYEADDNWKITNINLLRLKFNSSFKIPFIANEGFLKLHGIVPEIDQNRFLATVLLSQSNGRLHFGKGFNSLNQFTLQIHKNISATKIGTFSVKMFQKKMYGQIKDNCYSNWEINLLWEDQIMGKVKHSINEGLCFGPDSFYAAVELEQNIIYAFTVTENDKIQ